MLSVVGMRCILSVGFIPLSFSCSVFLEEAEVSCSLEYVFTVKKETRHIGK